jgi:hypothetical protein
MGTFQIGSDLTFQAVILVDQLDTMISSDSNFPDKQ